MRDSPIERISNEAGGGGIDAVVGIYSKEKSELENIAQASGCFASRLAIYRKRERSLVCELTGKN